MRPQAPVLLLAAILAALGVAGGVLAQPATTGATARNSTGRVWLRGGFGVSDNIYRVPQGEDSGNFFSIGVDSDFDYISSRLAVSLFADLEWREQSTDNVPDETYGQAIFDLEFAALPERISWIVHDEFSDGRLNPLAVSSPGNRTGANEFQTGPRFTLPLGARTSLNIDALVGDRHVADTSFLDSETEFGSLAVVRAMNTTTELAVNVTSNGVEYESPPTDIDTESAYLSYRKQLASGEAYVALGQTRSERGLESSTTPYIDVSWSRDIASRSRLEVRLQQQFGDFFDDPGFATGNESLMIRDVYEQQVASIGYAIEGDRNRFTIEQWIARADYTSIDTFDYDEWRTSAEYSRSISELAEFSVGYWTSLRDYDLATRDEDLSTWTLSFNRRLSRRTTIEAIYELSEDQALQGVSVEEGMIRVYVRYALTSGATQEI